MPLRPKRHRAPVVCGKLTDTPLPLLFAPLSVAPHTGCHAGTSRLTVCVCHVLAMCTAEQYLHLAATVLQPALTLAPACGLLDFGAVHLTGQRTLEVLISNPTLVEAAWQARVCPVTPDVKAGSGQPEVLAGVRSPNAVASPPATTVAAAAPAAAATTAVPFAVSPCNGVLAGRGLHMPFATRVRVTFAPVGSGTVTAQLWLHLVGAPPQVFTVTGTGALLEGIGQPALQDV